MRIGTQTFSGLYQFTSENLLIETARAITNMGSDTIKLYLGANFPGKYHTNVAPGVNSLLTLARNDPNCHYVLDLPFRYIIAWAYPFSNPDQPFQDGYYSPTEQSNDYREMYDLTRYLLTNYNNSGKTFYLGHWEGDGYLSVNNWSTNPSPAVVSNMIIWENNRQKAVDDARAASTTSSNVSVFYYLEVNRVRDAMLNNSNNNVRVVNCVLPYVTNIDFVSYSSYDGMNLNSTNLYTTLRCIETNTPPIPASKAGLLPPQRLWIGEYGWGGSQTPAQQEPTTRAYIQRLLNYSNSLPYILFWEIYDNETNSDGSCKAFFLIDTNNNKTPCFYLHQRFINTGRLLTACFKERYGRLPTDAEFVSMVSPQLDAPLPAPVNLSVANRGATPLSSAGATVSGTLTQGVYGDERATVWVFYGRQDRGASRDLWEARQLIAVNTNFNPATFTATLSNLVPQSTCFYRFYATNVSGEVWAPVSSQFSLQTLNPADYGCRLKLTFSGYNRGEVLNNFPVLVTFDTSLPGFAYRQFASATGGDLRFTDAGGSLVLPHEIDEWNTNGASRVWVRVPQLAGPTSFIWAYWGNPAAATPPAWTTNGSVWSADHFLVWHLKESGFPYADSAQQSPGLSGSSPPPAATTGLVGLGDAFNGSQYLSSAALNLGNAFTLSALVKIDPTASNIQTVWANKPGGWNSDGFGLFIDSWNTSDQKLCLETGDGVSGLTAVTGAGAVSFGQWHHIAAVADLIAGTAHLYVDGVDRTQSSAITSTLNNQGVVNLGRLTNNTFYLKGALDEVRLEAGTRSSNWVWANWMTTASNATLTAYSSVTQQPPPLTLSRNVNGLQLNWPGSGVGFSLYTTTNLALPAFWTRATNQPVWLGNQWQIALPPQNPAACYYRLQSP